jgi:hypothetical protein
MFLILLCKINNQKHLTKFPLDGGGKTSEGKAGSKTTPHDLNVNTVWGNCFPYFHAIFKICCEPPKLAYSSSTTVVLY